MRTFLKIAAVLLIIAVLALVWVAGNLGSLVKKAVETYAPPVLGTEVVLADATIMPFSGSGTLEGFTIAQPAGYGSGDAIALAKASLGIELSSLRTGPVIIREVLIDGPEVHYVQTSSGNNLQTLVGNVQRYSSSNKVGTEAGDGADSGEPDSGAVDEPGTVQEPGAKKPAKKLIVDQLTISNVKLSASSPLLPGQDVALVIAPIEMRDIGRAEGGLTTEQLLAQIGRKLNAEVQKSVADSDEFKALLEDAARQKAREEIDRTLDREIGGEGAKQVKGLLDRL